MSYSKENIRSIKNTIICLHSLHEQNKINDRQLDYLLRHICAYFVELQLQNLLDAYLPNKILDKISPEISTRTKK